MALDLVKIGFDIQAKGIKDANTEVDKLLDKAAKVANKKFIVDFSVGKSYKDVQKVLSDIEKKKKEISTTKMEITVVGYASAKKSLEKIVSLKSQVKEIKIAVTTKSNDLNTLLTKLGQLKGKNASVGLNVTGLADLRTAIDLISKVKAKALAVSVTASTKALVDLKAKLDAITSKTISVKVTSSAKDIKDLSNALKLLPTTDKTIKVTIKITPALQVLKDYNTELQRLASNSNISSNARLPNPSAASGEAKKAGNSSIFSNMANIAKFAILSTAVYALMNALKNLAVSFVSTADEMQNLTQRVSLYTPAGIEANAVFERMGEIAKQNRVTLADTGKLYTQLLPPIQRIKGGVNETIGVVDAFGKAMLIGGANTREAAAATVQFGQAMASGKLAGDEFRSLAEASPRLLQAIADGSGIAAAKLKEMSAAGKLTSGLVSSALLDQVIQLELEAKKMGQTVSGAFNEAIVSYQQFVKKFNEETGFTQGFVEVIRSATATLYNFGDGFIKQMKDGNSGLRSLVDLFKIVADLVIAINSMFQQTIGFIISGGEKLGVWKFLFDTIGGVVIAIVDTVMKLSAAILYVGTMITESVLTPFMWFMKLAAKGMDMAGFKESAASVNKSVKAASDGLVGFRENQGRILTGFNLLQLGVDKGTKSANNFSSVLDEWKAKNEDFNAQQKKTKAMTDQKALAELVALEAKRAGIAVGTEEYNLLKKQVELFYQRNQEAAKSLKLQGEAQAAEDAAKKAREKVNTDRKKAYESYEDQIAYHDRVAALLEQGVEYSVAKIAAEKEYATFIRGTAMAEDLISREQTKMRWEAAYATAEEAEQHTRIVEFMKQGISLEIARNAAQAAYTTNAKGLRYTQLVALNMIDSQLQTMKDQLEVQKIVNGYVKAGATSEEARLKAMVDRTNLSDEEKAQAKGMLADYQSQAEHEKNVAAWNEKINEAKRIQAVIADAISGKYGEQTSAMVAMMVANKGATIEAAKSLMISEANNELAKQHFALNDATHIVLTAENARIAEIRESMKGVVEADAKTLSIKEKILEKLKEHKKEVEDQKKTPIGDFSGVDFDVFGDFGNPFEAALTGLNEFLYKSKDIQTSYDAMFENIKQRFEAAKKAKEDTSKYELEYTSLATKREKELGEAKHDVYTKGLKFAKSFFKEESKGYKIVSGLEAALQAKKFAFALWEKKELFIRIGAELAFYARRLGAFLASTAAMITAQMGFNTTAGIGAVLSAAQQPGPAAFIGFAAMAALVAGLGVMVGGVGKTSGSFEAANEGTGTVFGDKEAKSESIKKSIEILADNSRVELPLTAAMLKSLRNIENNIGGLTNLLIRNQPAEGLAASVGQGFKLDAIGKGITGAFDWVNKLTFGLADMFTLGLFSAFGKMLGSAFGKKVSIKGQGLYGGSQDLGGIVTDGFNLQEYVDIQTKKKSFGITTSTKNSTRYSKADQELANQFGLIFKNFYDTILMAASPLDQNLNEVTTKLNNFVVKIGKINLQGLSGEKIQEKLEAIFGAAADNIARAAISGLDDFQRVGEGYFETLIRVATGIESATAYTSRLNVTAIKYVDIINKQGDVTTEIIRQSVLLAEGYKGIAGGFYDMVDAFDGGSDEITDFVLKLRELQDAVYATGKNGDYLTTSMFLGAGGLDRLSNGLEAYFEMLSPAEQAAELTRRLTNEFAIFGLQLPSDIKAFRNLVSSIDITSASGQKLYGQVIALAPEFNELQDSLETARDNVNGLVKSLRDLAEEARKARGETNQPRNLQAIRNEFDATSALAMQGDMTAAEKLLTLGKDLMQVSKQYSVSGSEYAKDLATVQKVATVSADVQELGLGYTPTTSLTPLTNAGTQTVETVNAGTDAKIEALRADLVTAITAVAKYTQDTSQRLQRWDYGDKMNVHVEQEVGDAPIKVQTV